MTVTAKDFAIIALVGVAGFLWWKSRHTEEPVPRETATAPSTGGRPATGGDVAVSIAGAVREVAAAAKYFAEGASKTS